MRFFSAFTVAALLAAFAFQAQATDVEFVNNQPFPVRMPIYLRGVAGTLTTPSQKAGDRVVVIADVPAAGTPVLLPVTNPTDQSVEPAENGVTLTRRHANLGTLTWGVVVHPMDPNARKVDPPPSTRTNFAATFKPIPLKFSRADAGPLFDTWRAEGSDAGLNVAVELRSFRAGFIDVDATVTNVSAPEKDVYAAVVCRWAQVGGSKRTIDYNNHVAPFDDGAFSPFRSGADRSEYIQRGVDWIDTGFAGGSVLWMNDFTPSFTVHKPATAKLPARWIGANTSQLAQEAQAAGGSVYSITEIARLQIKFYRSRVEDNVLPPPGEPLKISSRMVFDASNPGQQFIAYTGYNAQQATADKVRVTFGVAAVRFGTSYFPYSTLGENFITQRQPGMSTEGYWPLAPETVKHWDKFTDDVRGDLRIIKSMGFDLVRLHHFEVLYNKDAATGVDVVDEPTRKAYLDFLFGEIKSLGLKALLDVKLTPAQVADLVTRYGPQLDGVEIDNEVLIFGLPDDDVKYWNDVYAAVKKVAPNLSVHLTAHTNTGAFDRVAKLGGPFDKIGEHAYLDSLDAIPAARDYALAAADYGAKVGKEPTITEWNWRFLTRMTFDARAKVYPPIFDDVLATRSVPTVYQFQFQDTLGINPATLRGMRRYELLLLSRRPKPEAMAFEHLVTTYAAKDAPHQVLDVEHRVVELAGGKGTAAFELVNRGDRALKLSATVEGPSDVTASAARSIEVPAHGTAALPVAIELKRGSQALPGFYHVFLRLEGPDGFLRYGWAEARNAGAPKIDKSPTAGVTYGPGALDFDFNRPLAVVYADDAAPTDVEAAWTLFITLESATGRAVEIYQAKDLPADNTRAVIRVEAKKEKAATVRLEGEQLLVTGAGPKEVLAAAMDLTLRYWKYAKDSAIPRVGLTTERVEQKGNKTDLE